MKDFTVGVEYKVLRNYAIGLALLLFGLFTAAYVSGCSVLGGGQTNPILSKLVPNTLSDYGPTLAGQCQESCNVGACKEYGLNMVICANPNGFVSQLPGNPFATPAQITAAITAVCNTNGYTASSPATVTAGNCVFTPPAPSPSAAH